MSKAGQWSMHLCVIMLNPIYYVPHLRFIYACGSMRIMHGCVLENIQQKYLFWNSNLWKNPIFYCRNDCSNSIFDKLTLFIDRVFQEIFLWLHSLPAPCECPYKIVPFGLVFLSRRTPFRIGREALKGLLILSK